jgi:nitrogenase molybdenum-cofactor synthesis protein NifE
MVELVRQIDLAINNPMWDEIRLPAPWDSEGRIGHSLPDATPASSPEGEDIHYVARIRKKFADTVADDIGDD